MVAHAGKKRKAKGADWIVANDVSPETRRLGGDGNTVHLVTAGGVEDWPTHEQRGGRERLMLRAASTCAATLRLPMTAARSKSSRACASRLAARRDLPLPAYQSAGAAGLDLWPRSTRSTR